ncbi:MAG TPA: glycosyltransferase family 9 protein [Pyrinomonadaceae bacterium]|jgi:ADP-heptose:LPS heptosyltransferase|nr:glycosyltransferase family 9 protein [Pyrinomonadaceae bacterium]
MNLDPRNILVIDFGQMGDVMLSLPALAALRQRFPRARITVAVGKPGRQIVELTGSADEVMVVDRVALRDGFAPASLFRIAQIVKEVRRRRFDFVVDLHSLSETNLLGYFSGAPQRLYSRRPGRSLDFLSNFRPAAPVEDREKHAVERYLDVLAPLRVGEVSRAPRLPLREEAERAVDQLFRKLKIGRDAPLVGVFPGAGNPSREWRLERFAEIAERVARNDGLRTVVFLGPEERARSREIRAAFPPRTTSVVDNLDIPRLACALARMSVLVSNDTGPVHVAAAVGTPAVVLVGRPTRDGYEPVGERHRVIYGRDIDSITVEEVYAATRTVLAAERTTAIFAS